jgi:hypothetical protein
MKRQFSAPTTLHGEDEAAEGRLLLLADQIHTAAQELRSRLAHLPKGEVTASADQRRDWEHVVVNCIEMSERLQHDTHTPIEERIVAGKKLLGRMERLLQITEHWKTILLDQYRRLVHEVARLNQQLQSCTENDGRWWNWWSRRTQIHKITHALDVAQRNIQDLIQVYPNVQELFLRSQTIPEQTCLEYGRLQQQIQNAYDHTLDQTSSDNYKRQQLQLQTARLKIGELLTKHPGLGMTDATCAETETLLTQAESVTGLHRVALMQEYTNDRIQTYYALTVNRYKKLQSIEPAAWRVIAHRHWQTLYRQTERQIAWLATRLQVGKHPTA